MLRPKPKDDDMVVAVLRTERDLLGSKKLFATSMRDASSQCRGFVLSSRMLKMEYMAASIGTWSYKVV
jgi:hypothetical protein